jgi:hypothetical protein
MPRDVLAPVEPLSGPRKRILTEKAKEAALAQSTKRVRPGAAEAPSISAHSVNSGTSRSN